MIEKQRQKDKEKRAILKKNLKEILKRKERHHAYVKYIN